MNYPYDPYLDGDWADEDLERDGYYDDIELTELTPLPEDVQESISFFGQFWSKIRAIFIKPYYIF